MRKYLKDYFIELCCSYTVISVLGAVTNMIYGSETNNANVIAMFIFSAIAVFVLSLHKLLQRFSPLAMILIQFIVSLALCCLVVYVISLFDTVTPRGWFEFIRSFVIVYAIGAAYYYYRVFSDAKKQNNLIAEIQKLDQEKNRDSKEE